MKKLYIHLQYNISWNYTKIFHEFSPNYFKGLKAARRRAYKRPTATTCAQPQVQPKERLKTFNEIGIPVYLLRKLVENEKEWSWKHEITKIFIYKEKDIQWDQLLSDSPVHRGCVPVLSVSKTCSQHGRVRQHGAASGRVRWSTKDHIYRMVKEK